MAYTVLPRSPVILGARRHASYDDVPAAKYHFPRAKYESAVRAAEGEVALIYEPRRGGTGPESAGGGRSSFIAYAVLGAVEDDPNDPASAYVRYWDYEELPVPVPLSATNVNAKAIQQAVLRVDMAVVDSVFRYGMAPILSANADTVGLTDRALPALIAERPIREVAFNQLVRDRAFRYNVVDKAYRGTCAMSGLHLTNGKGRAEVDAVHIRPVAEGGPDVIGNGLALSKTLHWAFDRGLVSATDEGRILFVDRGLPDDLRRLLRPELTLVRPSAEDFSPHPAFLGWHRRLLFKGEGA
jgi:putative restriction endonuclease